MNSRELLIDTFAFMPPRHAIDGLSPADAERRLPNAPHSIAEIVAHLVFWQTWFTRRAEGIHDAMVTSAALGWPAVADGSWNDLRSRFEAGLERLAEVAGNVSNADTLLSPPLEFPPLAHYTIRDTVTHVANHNAHHFGQIVVLRQMMGLWPPPSGSWTF